MIVASTSHSACGNAQRRVAMALGHLAAIQYSSLSRGLAGLMSSSITQKSLKKTLNAPQWSADVASKMRGEAHKLFCAPFQEVQSFFWNIPLTVVVISFQKDRNIFKGWIRPDLKAEHQHALILSFLGQVDKHTCQICQRAHEFSGTCKEFGLVLFRKNVKKV